MSEGCRNCYAERVAARFSGPEQPYSGLAILKDKGPQWTGEVRFMRERLEDPLHRRKPRMIFVNSMSDLFHEKVPASWIADIFSIIETTPHHTYQILTKRPWAMLAWIKKFDAWLRYAANSSFAARFPHVWLGVSVEDQGTANERVPALMETPAAVRWISYEPALGPVQFIRWIDPMSDAIPRPLINWIVCGGESGPGARPMSTEWASSVLRLCQRTYSTKFFMKQLGGWPDKRGNLSDFPEELRVREYPECRQGLQNRTVVARPASAS